MSPSICLITIDAAGTLIRPWPSVGAVYGKTARKHGLIVDDSVVDSRFYSVFGSAQKNKQITGGEEKEFWRYVVYEVFRPFSNGRELHKIFEELWDMFAHGDHWRLAEGAKNTLHQLLERGYRLAVLSNNDSRLRGVLKDLKIDCLFEEIFISAELGCEKPDLAIFRKVESQTGVEPNQILHLGDSHSRDFEGARHAGWSALLFGLPLVEENQISSFPELLEFLP